MAQSQYKIGFLFGDIMYTKYQRKIEMFEYITPACKMYNFSITFPIYARLSVIDLVLDFKFVFFFFFLLLSLRLQLNAAYRHTKLHLKNSFEWEKWYNLNFWYVFPLRSFLFFLVSIIIICVSLWLWLDNMRLDCR